MADAESLANLAVYSSSMHGCSTQKPQTCQLEQAPERGTVVDKNTMCKCLLLEDAKHPSNLKSSRGLGLPHKPHMLTKLCVAQDLCDSHHVAKWFHRDLKPANVVVSGWSEAMMTCKLVDWAGARADSESRACTMLQAEWHLCLSLRLLWFFLDMQILLYICACIPICCSQMDIKGTKWGICGAESQIKT